MGVTAAQRYDILIIIELEYSSMIKDDIFVMHYFTTIDIEKMLMGW